MRLVVWWILAQACMVADQDKPANNLDSDTIVGDDTDASEPDPPDSDPFADEARVRAFLAGDGSGLDALLHDIAWSNGWPVTTEAGTRLFLAEGAEGWSLAGDFNQWSPAPMTPGAGYAWAEVEVGEPWDVGYKFVRQPGTADEAWTADPWARAYRYDDFGRISFVAAGSDSPHLERWPAFAGRGLLPRDIDVWVPAGAGPWPLLVMHDGRNLFDPRAIWGGWRLGDALATTAPVLVVALDNTPDRMTEYVHADDTIEGLGAFAAQGSAYADLVALDVVPWAEATWQTTGRRGVMGSSLGGLISLFIALEHPDTFDFAGSLSGTLGWGRFGENNPTIGELYASNNHFETSIYVDSGGGDGGDGCTDPDGDGWPEDDPNSEDNYCESTQFIEALESTDWAEGTDLRTVWSPGAPHNEAAWAERVGEPLRYFLSFE